MMSTGVEVKVENQLVRFTCPEPVGQELVVAQLGGVEIRWSSYQNP